MTVAVGLTCLWGDQQSRFLSQDTGSGREYLTRSREGGFCMVGVASHVCVVWFLLVIFQVFSVFMVYMMSE